MNIENFIKNNYQSLFAMATGTGKTLTSLFSLNELGVTGMTATQVMGCGVQKGAGEKYRGVEMDATLLPKIKVEVIVNKIPVEKVIEAAKKALYTGHIGDGKIFVYNVQNVVKVRTGEEGPAALQDVE